MEKQYNYVFYPAVIFSAPLWIRLWWLGHVWRMEKDGRAKQILHWVPERRKRRGRPWKNWTETATSDLRGLEMSWERAEELAMDRDEWRRCVARCAEMHRMD